MKKLIALLAFVCLPAFAQPIYYGGPGDGVTDNSASMNAAEAQICNSSNVRTLYVPCGTYRFTQPPAAPTCALNLVGEGKACTIMVKDYSNIIGAYLFKRQQNASDTYGGGAIRDLTILAGPLSSNGAAIWIVASPDVNGVTFQTKNPHGMLIDNLMIGAFPGGGVFSYGIYLDGSSNHGPGAPGIRSVNIRNTSVNSSNIVPIYLNYAVGTTISGTECFGTYAYPLGVDGGSDSNVIMSRTCIPNIINGVNTYKWP
jgi:hypothetical protein